MTRAAFVSLGGGHTSLEEGHQGQQRHSRLLTADTVREKRCRTGAGVVFLRTPHRTGDRSGGVARMANHFLRCNAPLPYWSKTPPRLNRVLRTRVYSRYSRRRGWLVVRLDRGHYRRRYRQTLPTTAPGTGRDQGRGPGPRSGQLCRPKCHSVKLVAY